MLELEIANIGAIPTYIKGEKSSIVDLTFVDPRLSREGSYLQVSIDTLAAITALLHTSFT